MFFRRNSRRRRVQRTATTTAKAVRSFAIVRAIVAILGRRRATALLARTGPLGLLAAGLMWVVRRRRQRKQLEADLGPPNQSAPGDFQPSATTPTAAQQMASDQAPAPNEGATAHEPQPGADAPVGGEGGAQGAASPSDGGSAGDAAQEPVARQPMG